MNGLVRLVSEGYFRELVNIVVMFWVCVRVMYFWYWKLVWCIFSVCCSGMLLSVWGR